MTDLNLKTFNKLYPMMIRKYSDLIIDQNASEKDKINSIILKLNALGKLSNDVVRDWNTVYQWVMNDGLTQDVNNKLEDMLAKGEFNSIIDALVAEIGDLTTLTTPQKDTVVHSINSLQSEVTTNTTQLVDIVKNIKGVSDLVSFFADTSKTITVLIPSQVNVTSNLIIPSNYILKFSHDGKFNVTSGITLSINGYIDAPPKQIFSATGTFNGLPLNEFGYVEWFGLNGTDDTSAFQRTINLFRKTQLLSTYYVSSISVPTNYSIVGSIGEFDKLPTIVHLSSATDNCIKLVDGYSGSVLEGFKITGGANNLYAIQCHRPHSKISKVVVTNYYGNGLDIGHTNTGSWCTKVEHFNFIGYADVSRVSQATMTIGINIDPNGGNIIIDKCNIQLAVKGIKVTSGDQVTISNSNISEISYNQFPNASDIPKAVHVLAGTNIALTKCYIENFSCGTWIDSVNLMTVENVFYNGLSVASTGIRLESSNTKNVTISNTMLITNYSNAVSIALSNAPANTVIINTDYDKTKFTNNLNSYFIEIGLGTLTGKYNGNGAFRTSLSWTSAFGSTASGTYTVGSITTDKNYSNMVYSNHGIVNASLPVYLLPASAPIGTVLTFIKTYQYRNTGTLTVRPQGSDYIFPTPALTIKGRQCISGNSGSITFIKSDIGWCETSTTGTWQDEV